MQRVIPSERSFSCTPPTLVPNLAALQPNRLHTSANRLNMSVLPAHQLRDLNEITAGVVQHGDLGSRHVRWWHGELGAARFHPFVVSLHVVGEEHGRGLALLEQGLLVGF